MNLFVVPLGAGLIGHAFDNRLFACGSIEQQLLTSVCYSSSPKRSLISVVMDW